MPFGTDEEKGYGLVDIWFKPSRAKRVKKVINFCLDATTVGGVGALVAVAWESTKSEACAYGARRLVRGACVALLTPAAAASVGSVMIAYSGAEKATKVCKTGNFLWNGGIGTIKMVATGATLPQQGISLLLCGTMYTPLVHNQTLTTNMTAVTEGLHEGLSIINATALKEASKEILVQATKDAINKL